MVSLTWEPVGGWLGVVALVVGLLMLLPWGPPRSKARGQRRYVLLGLRLGSFVVLLLAWFRPTLVYTQLKPQQATVVLLADKSRSMSIPDGIGGQSRYEVLRQTLADAKASLRSLAEQFELKAYAFDAYLEPLQVADGQVLLPDTPQGNQTALGAALDDLLQQEAGKRILGVLLLSDGVQQARPPRDLPVQTAAARLKAQGIPLYTFPIGQSRGLGQAQDVRLSSLRCNPTVFVKNELNVSADLEAYGYVHRSLVVRLLFETQPGQLQEVARKEVDVQAAGERMAIDFVYVPSMPGDYKLSVRVEPQQGELITTNNEMATFVRVLKGGINVLYLEGQVRVESRFLLQALQAAPNVQVDFYRISRDPTIPLERGPTAAFVRPAELDLSEAFRPGKYDVYILGDLDSAAFRPEELAQLAEAVSQRAGLLMLGGFHSFAPGGYGQTPLAKVLPVAMDRFGRQRFEEKIREDMHLPGPIRMVPTPIGQRASPMRLATDPEENRKLWLQLPPLEGINRLGSPAPGALVWATDQAQNPVLVAHSFGGGRVLAFAADSTWRWWMRGFQTEHRRFWRQVILWLAQADEAEQADLWIKLAQRRFAPGDRVEFQLGVNDPAGQPIRQAQFRAEVQLPNGRSEPIPLVSTDSGWQGAFLQTDLPGDYTLRATAKLPDGQELTSTARFLVFEQDLELDLAAADIGTMETIATMTGGQALAPEQLPSLLQKLLRETSSLQIEQVRKLSLWDTWPMFLLFVGLLGTEWYLRKRWGLV
ncbi:MAG: hypothetical protein NZ602_09435 [Thermoguttaceae bacterium]|nr:hypothetical protein [Thermoguttaceae bacterium]MDW8039089.1 hypothetical protein [Thermoguttaceae bacterium]